MVWKRGRPPFFIRQIADWYEHPSKEHLEQRQAHRSLAGILEGKQVGPLFLQQSLPVCTMTVQTGSLSGVSLLDLLYDLCDELVKGDTLQESRDRDDHVQVRTDAVLQFDGHQRVDTQSAELLVSIEL